MPRSANIIPQSMANARHPLARLKRHVLGAFILTISGETQKRPTGSHVGGIHHSMNQISDSRYRHQEVMVAGVRATLPVFATVVVFSFFVNLLLFVSPLYMLQIYDRVITSRSETTLLSLTVLAAILIGVYAALETLRSRLLVRAGLLFDEKIAEPVFNAVHRGNLRQPGAQPRASPARRRHRPRILDRRRTDSALRCALVSAVCSRRLSAAFLVRLHRPRGQRHYIEPDAPERNRNKEVAERRRVGRRRRPIKRLNRCPAIPKCSRRWACSAPSKRAGLNSTEAR